MSRSTTVTTRSGDPRKRAAAEAARPVTRTRTRLVVVAVAGAACVLLAVLLGMGAEDGPDARARARAASTCELMSGAEEAGRVDTDARYAASMLLLDKAVIESARAAKVDAEYADLDLAVRAAHRAAHRRDPEQYRTAMASAIAACRSLPD
jgi:hypothetical protein